MSLIEMTLNYLSIAIIDTKLYQMLLLKPLQIEGTHYKNQKSPKMKKLEQINSQNL